MKTGEQVLRPTLDILYPYILHFIAIYLVFSDDVSKFARAS